MTLGQAQELVGKLSAAFSRDWSLNATEATNLVYVEQFAKLERYEAARDAVDVLIASETRLPLPSLIVETYRRYFDRYSPPALMEAELTDEQRAENLKRIRELAGRFGGQTL